MCMTRKMHECGCQEECGCTTEEKLQMLELSKKCIQTRFRSIDRRIAELKEKNASAGS